MTLFKIAAAQIPSIAGDLDINVEQHLKAIESASRHGISVLVFPELSLMGYEPELAHSCELSSTDARLESLADLAQKFQMQVVVGAAIKSEESKPYLGGFVLGADATVRPFAKMHLGGCEPKHFISGRTWMSIECQGERVGLAICADTSQKSHPATHVSRGATIYAASVFLNSEWYVTDSPRYASYAAEFGILCLMANHAASTGSLVSVGNSAVWAPGGRLLASAIGTQAALVVATRTNGQWAGELVAI